MFEALLRMNCHSQSKLARRLAANLLEKLYGCEIIAAGAIVTRDVPPGSVAFGVNQSKPKDPNYDLAFNANMLEPAEMIDANEALIEKFEQTR